MSVSPVTAVSQAHQTTDQTEATTPAPSVTPFSQQLDAQDTQTEAAHGRHHHHRGAASQSVTSSAATAASAAGVTPSSAAASSVLNLLS
jgi:hypothetical protein